MLISSLVIFSAESCKSLAKASAKRWAKKKRKEFLHKCNDGAASKFGEKGEEFCDCALDLVMDKYPNPDDGLSLKFIEILKLTKDCISQ